MGGIPPETAHAGWDSGHEEQYRLQVHSIPPGVFELGYA